MKTLQSKVFLSDEGYGHIVRQRAIIEAMRDLGAPISFTVQTQHHIDAATRLINDVDAVTRYNNITWHKLPNGSPDLAAIRMSYAGYLERSQAWLEEEAEAPDYDFVLSDFVYEAFAAAKQRNVPAFGVAHFTWDWFFAKLYPPPLSTEVIYRFFEMAKMAEVLYFPPFTPEEILHYYRDNARQVPLILRKEINHKKVERNGRFRVMIMDSGSGLLQPSIEKALDCLRDLDDFQFFVSSKMSRDQNNVSFIDENELMVDYIGDMDLVIGRAGFNTISECIGLRTPMLLIGEAMNPEMSENILNLKKCGLGTFISIEAFREDLAKLLPQFIRNEYKSIVENMRDHEMEVNGAEIIAQDILNRIS